MNATFGESWRSIGRRVPPHWLMGTEVAERTTPSRREARTQVVALARTRYARVNHTHLTELLAEREEIVLGRLTVEDFASKLSDFFMRQWQAAQMPPDGPPMVFLVGGYDEGAPYGRVFECFVPTAPQPKEQHPGSDQFGMVWGGQREFTDRIITGFDGQLPGIVQDILALDDHQRDNLNQSQGGMYISGGIEVDPIGWTGLGQN